MGFLLVILRHQLRRRYQDVVRRKRLSVNPAAGSTRMTEWGPSRGYSPTTNGRGDQKGFHFSSGTRHDEVKFRVKKRLVREWSKLIKEKFKRKIQEEELASGIDVGKSEKEFEVRKQGPKFEGKGARAFIWAAKRACLIYLGQTSQTPGLRGLCAATVFGCKHFLVGTQM